MQSFYSIRDGKAEVYSPPFLARSDGEAIRMVMQSLDGASQLSRFPDDFTLYRIGEWFEESAVMEATVPIFVAHVSSCVPGGTLNPVRAKAIREDYGAAEEETWARANREQMNGADEVSDEAPVQSGAVGDDSEEHV